MAPAKTITVTYDIAFLGKLHSEGASHSGLARVCHDLLIALLAREDIEVRVVASAHCHSARNYALENGFGDRFFGPDNLVGFTCHAVASICHRVKTAIRSRNCKQVHWLGLFYSAIWRIEYWCGQFFKSSTECRAVQQADIYFTPFGNLPSRDELGSQTLRCMFIHDMLPLINETWFEETSIHVFKEMIQTATYDCILIANSESTRSDAIQILNYPKNQVFTAYLAADESRFHPVRCSKAFSAMRERFGIGESAFFLSVCTLEPRKNLDMVVQAFCRLAARSELTDIKLVLVGSSGWKTDALHSALSQAGEFRTRIILTGFVDDTELAPLYSSAVAFVYPSLYEGFGLPPLEAMQCGTPVITSNVSSIPEVVGDAAVMFEPCDVDGISAAMFQAATSADWRRDHSVKGLARAKMFSWERCADQVVHAFNAAIAERIS